MARVASRFTIPPTQEAIPFIDGSGEHPQLSGRQVKKPGRAPEGVGEVKPTKSQLVVNVIGELSQV